MIIDTCKKLDLIVSKLQSNLPEYCWEDDLRLVRGELKWALTLKQMISDGQIVFSDSADKHKVKYITNWATKNRKYSNGEKQ